MDNDTEICGLALGGIDSLSPTVYYGNQRRPVSLCSRLQKMTREVVLDFSFLWHFSVNSNGKELLAVPR